VGGCESGEKLVAVKESLRKEKRKLEGWGSETGKISGCKESLQKEKRKLEGWGDVKAEKN
jgi:hypothetical protein